MRFSGRIIFCLLNFFIQYTSAQEFVSSRSFQTTRKNIPLAIINEDEDHFYLLRYNRLAHDIVIEQRKKPEAEYLRIFPLRMDSVNANWFDYDKLDYLFFKHNSNIYFVFEKVLNTRRWIYMKVIDSLGRKSGFIEIASLVRDKNSVDISFRFRHEDGKLVITSNQQYLNGIVRKKLSVFDLEQRQILRTVPLPVESSAGGYSTSSEMSDDGDLYFLIARSEVESYKRQYMNHYQVTLPVLFHDSLFICRISSDNKFTKVPVDMAGFSTLHTAKIFISEKQAAVALHVSKFNEGQQEQQVYFHNQAYDRSLAVTLFEHTTPLLPEISSKLTYYDGSDSKVAGDKVFFPVRYLFDSTFVWAISERREPKFFKELLLYQINMQTGRVEEQFLVPRKLYDESMGRFKQAGIPVLNTCKGAPRLVIPENSHNLKKQPSDYRYSKFDKQRSVTRANIMLYTPGKDGALTKKLLMRNGDFDYVPLQYSSNRCDMIFYQVRGKVERFIFLQ